ncbi:hypothetical protein L336_0172 [Candidatus Saccharimonas aalborgensis]|uniref:Uncharacterized protein n=1 Tax=Candidatus Saccharimonas aalborgensis TaxID=1332188 RepID=R4PVV8_9BACT|nr:hypothetical protein [Candidatus Saccharimonas aalborgensis]AGL61882.1 hypothetical protein L336_0172 [Candidatus Saccharimonas aalborgensis]QQR51681.1 MAG: hypothetical protein IPF89_02570 [Candidatus Saccharibacteria bacterium]QQS68413.1 MAG: hypothetical protein IPP24_05425 [Candidatus Saccharibacteria bacterium]
MAVADYVNVNFGYSDIFGEMRSVKQVGKELQDYNLWAVLIVASKLSIVLYKTPVKDNNEQIKLLRSFFSQETREKIAKLFQARKNQGLSDEWVFFTEPPLLALIALAIDNCDSDAGQDIATPEQLEQFGKWLLVLTEQWTHRAIAPRGMHYRMVNGKPKMTKYAVERMRMAFAEQSFLTSRPNILHQLARTTLIVKRCASNPHNLDIEQLFTDATGVTISDYIGFGFSLMTEWSIHSSEPDLDNDVVRDMDYFSQMKLTPEQLQTLLGLYTMKLQDYESENKEVISTVLRGSPHQNNFMVFMRHPVIMIGQQKIMCASPRLLANRTTLGVYWQMNEYLNRVDDKSRLGLLPKAWSVGFEKYALDRLESGFGSSKVIRNFTIKRYGELADGLVLGNKALLIIEAKALHIPYKMQLYASRPNMKSSLQQLFGTKKTRNPKKKHKRKGLQQIDHFVSLLRDNAVQIPGYKLPDIIVPILVTEDDLPADPINRRYYNGYASSVTPTLSRNKLYPFVILHIEELEYLEAIAEKSTQQAEELIIEYCERQLMKNDVGMPTEVASFKNFIDWKDISLKNTKSLHDEFGKITDDLCKRFFSQ